MNYFLNCLVIASVIFLIVFIVDKMAKKKKANILRKEVLEFLMDFKPLGIVGFNNDMIVQTCCMTEEELKKNTDRLIGFSIVARMLDWTFEWSWDKDILTYRFCV